MKWKTTAIILALIAGVRISSAALNIGDAMVDGNVKMKNVDGKMTTLNTIKGNKGILVIFSCNHCPVARAWQKTMVKIGNTYQSKGFGVVFINSNDPAKYKQNDFEEMQKLAKAEGYQFPYVVDATSDVARHFGATKTPDVFLFDASGKLVYKGAVGEGGFQPKTDGEPYLRNALDAVLAGKPIAKPETRGLGCSIKFR